LKGQLSYRLLFSNVLQGLLDHLSPQSEWLLSLTYSYVTPKTSATGLPRYYIPCSRFPYSICLICERVLYTQKLQNTLTWCMTIEISNIRQDMIEQRTTCRDNMPEKIAYIIVQRGGMSDLSNLATALQDQDALVLS